MTERIRAADLKAALTKPKGTKRVQGAEPFVVDGIKFHSKREAQRWQELRLLEIAGHISDLQRQVPIVLMGQDGPVKTDSGNRDRIYVADFVYRDHKLDFARVVEDAKGYATEVFKIKKAILAAQGVEVIEV